MDNIFLVNTPVVQDLLLKLRNRKTKTREFRTSSDMLCSALLSSAFFQEDFTGSQNEVPILVPVLRSGIAMLPSALRIFPDAKIGVVGFKRDEKTFEAREYYWNMPEVNFSDTIFILDPMVATGGTTHAIVRKLFKSTTKVRVVSIICATAGIEKIHTDFPDVPIITAAVDKELNSRKYIVPGLGDFGDRYFGTE